MIVVSDTSPLNYLTLLGCSELLSQLFGDVYIPPVVANELRHSRAPQAVKQWASSPPAWLHVVEPRIVDHSLGIDVGEAQAIALAREMHADAILIDDLRGRVVVERMGLRPFGTLAILESASIRGLVDLQRALDDLEETNFRAPKDRILEMRGRDRARREPSP